KCICGFIAISPGVACDIATVQKTCHSTGMRMTVNSSRETRGYECAIRDHGDIASRPMSG
ncbi:hypothetical protein, partial [Burkholderia sp.]|uniref:hypothetical protein n=1 Tax=Burkholderia sp. TaxID=36773 RepID=UPI002590E070